MSSSVTSDSVVMGIPIAPNGTAAVFPSRARAAALIGLKPSATIITEVIAAGAPKPASASISVPKQKAIITAWIR